MIVGIRGDEYCFFLVLRCQGNLMIPLKGVQKAHPRVSVCGIYQLVNLRYRKRVFWACLVQIHEIYTNPPLAILLLHYHGIC